MDLFPQIGNEYYATGIGAVFHADEIMTSLRSDEICFRGMEHTRTLTYGEAENFIDSGIALLHPECIPPVSYTHLSLFPVHPQAIISPDIAFYF